MDWKKEWKPPAAIIGVFLASYFLPLGKARFDGAIMEALYLVKWYAREHVLLCLVPAFFIAEAIALSIVTSTDKGEAGEWFLSTWGFVKQILPLLFIGVIVAGALLGRPGHEGLIPSSWVNRRELQARLESLMGRGVVEPLEKQGGGGTRWALTRGKVFDAGVLSGKKV